MIQYPLATNKLDRKKYKQMKSNDINTTFAFAGPLTAAIFLFTVLKSGFKDILATLFSCSLKFNLRKKTTNYRTELTLGVLKNTS